jgi:DNA-binding beta-propeller fold protein YncE
MASKALCAATLALTLTFSALVAAQDTGPYKVLEIQLIGGDGAFDYVTADPDGRNLYVARSGPAGHIGVLNLDTLAQVGDIPGTSAHGAAVDTATGHGFATSSPVIMFDAKTFAVLKKIDVQGIRTAISTTRTITTSTS